MLTPRFCRKAPSAPLFVGKEIELKSTGSSLDERTKKKHDRYSAQREAIVIHKYAADRLIYKALHAHIAQSNDSKSQFACFHARDV
jgi:hypothetical protein